MKVLALREVHCASRAAPLRPGRLRQSWWMGWLQTSLQIGGGGGSELTERVPRAPSPHHPPAESGRAAALDVGITSPEASAAGAALEKETAMREKEAAEFSTEEKDMMDVGGGR